MSGRDLPIDSGAVPGPGRGAAQGEPRVKAERRGQQGTKTPQRAPGRLAIRSGELGLQFPAAGLCGAAAGWEV